MTSPTSPLAVALLASVYPGAAPLQIAHDPDGMLLDEIALATLAARGFAVLPWQDEVTFRLEYETRFRGAWDDGRSPTEAAVLIHFAGESPEELPWDIVTAAKLHRLSLADWFSGLDLSVVRALPNPMLDLLYDQYMSRRPGALGANATADFILVNVYRIADSWTDTESDLLRLLLDLHLRQVVLPTVLVDRLAASLIIKPALSAWPIRQLLAERSAFLAFVEDRWPIAVEAALRGDRSFQEPTPKPYTLRIPGPAALPFSDDSVRILVDNLFAEGLLPRLAIVADVSGLPIWMRAGVVTNEADDDSRQLVRLLGILRQRLAQETLRHGDWGLVGWAWAEAQAVWHRLPLDRQGEHTASVDELRDAMDASFAEWMGSRYGALASLPSVSGPAIGHRVPEYLGRRLDSPAKKVALVVMDGMAMDQWVLLQHLMEQTSKSFEFQRSSMFAWLPTLTSVARQAMFAGTLPRNLASLTSTQGEPAAWSRVWVAQGLQSHAVAYLKAIRRIEHVALVDEVLADHRVRVLGVVVDAVDEIMHGMTLGTRGLHDQVESWQEHGLLGELFHRLLASGFEIFVTADHGNIEARGAGRVAQGVLAETRGERVRLYSDQVLYQNTLSQLQGRGVPGATTGLPDGRYPLYAAGRSAFVDDGDIIVAHGGTCIEEVIVPFVQVSRRVAPP